MKNVQIRNVPERIHKVLRRRAADAGQSLQEYLMQMLEESASRLTMDEWLERVEKLPKSRFPPGDAARIIREERDKRDAEIDRRADRS